MTFKQNQPFSTARGGPYGEAFHLLINKYSRDHEGARQYSGYEVLCKSFTQATGFHDYANLEEAKANVDCKPCLSKVAKIEANFITLYKLVGDVEIDVTLCPAHLKKHGELFGVLNGSSDDDFRSLTGIECEVCQQDQRVLGFVGLLVEKIGREIAAHAE